MSRLRSLWLVTLTLASVGGSLIAAPGASAAPGRLDELVIARLNILRLQTGLEPFVTDTTLSLLASERSADMAARGYLSHNSAENVPIWKLLEMNGIGYQSAGESVALNTSEGSEAVDLALQTFLSSPAHRSIVLGREFSQVGAGVSTTDGQTYVSVIVVQP